MLEICKDLTRFFPMFPFDPPENIRKSNIFWCFQEDQKETLEGKWLNFNGYMKVWIVNLLYGVQLPNQDIN